MNTNNKPVYKIRGFIPFITIAFINALVDLGHKIIIQNTIFKLYDESQQIILTTIVNGLILLPFILLFTPAGFLADHISKPKIMQWSALAAIVITLLITLGYYQGWFLFTFCMTFILALQSALYSPAKYGYIREIAGNHRIASGNAFIQAVTIVAILSGIFLFSILFEHFLHKQNYSSEQDIIQLIAPIGWLLVGLSTIEWLLTLKLPTFITSQNSLFSWHHFHQRKSIKDNVSLISKIPVIWFSILGLSLFWGISQTLLATFPAFAKTVLNESNTIVIQGLLACAGIGIVIGSLIAGRLTNSASDKLLIIGSVGIISALFILPHCTTSSGFALTIVSFGVFGGLIIVPLNTLIQSHAPNHQLGTILAGNNWMQNSVMLSFLLFTMLTALFTVNSHIILFALPILSSLFIIAMHFINQRVKMKT
ncbi:MAG: MFS transporter [Piscirickettsiaceae bacterium]|nr:MFS transporter [Piscirickettsiaceae bacterium]